MKKFSLLTVVLFFGIVVISPSRSGALLTADYFASAGFSFGNPVPKSYDSTNLWKNLIIWHADPAEPTDPNISGIHATNGWAQDNTQLSWDIKGSGGLYTYEYWWSTKQKNLSHIIIELTDIVWEPGVNIIFNESQFSYDTEIKEFSPSDCNGNSNPGMPEGGGFMA